MLRVINDLQTYVLDGRRRKPLVRVLKEILCQVHPQTLHDDEVAPVEDSIPILNQPADVWTALQLLQHLQKEKSSVSALLDLHALATGQPAHLTSLLYTSLWLSEGSYLLLSLDGGASDVLPLIQFVNFDSVLQPPEANRSQ